MKYIVALAVAGMISAGLFGYAANARKQFLISFRDSLRKAQEAGEIPAEITDAEIDSVTPEGWETELDAETIQLIDTAEMIERFWFIWIPLLIAICLGVAWLVPVNSSRGN